MDLILQLMLLYREAVETPYHVVSINEPRHDKTNIMGLRPAWIQTSLRIRAVWSGSMMFTISFSTCYRVCKRTTWILIRLHGSAGWSGSMLVANALCWFCRDAAQIKTGRLSNNKRWSYYKVEFNDEILPPLTKTRLIWNTTETYTKINVFKTFQKPSDCVSGYQLNDKNVLMIKVWFLITYLIKFKVSYSEIQTYPWSFVEKSVAIFNGFFFLINLIDSSEIKKV
jgi:hypothetical protein